MPYRLSLQNVHSFKDIYDIFLKLDFFVVNMDFGDRNN